MASNGRIIKLQSKEGDIFDIDIASIKQSEVLIGFSENSKECTIPVDINSTALRKVIEWMDYHKNDIPQSEQDDDENREKGPAHISDWDENFLNISTELLFELISAANYLSVKSLLDVTCKKIANMIKGQSPENIYRMFNIKRDHTSAREA